jgi:hypothetical protein
LYPVVQAVHDVKVVFLVKSDARRTVQLPITAAGFAPLVKELAIFVEDGDALEVFIGDVDIATAVNVNGNGPDKLPVSRARAAELADKFMLRVADADALAQFLSAPVHYVNNPIGSKGEVQWVPESQTGHAVHSQAMAEGKYPSGGNCGKHCYLPTGIRLTRGELAFARCFIATLLSMT